MIMAMATTIQPMDYSYEDYGYDYAAYGYTTTSAAATCVRNVRVYDRSRGTYVIVRRQAVC